METDCITQTPLAVGQRVTYPDFKFSRNQIQFTTRRGTVLKVSGQYVKLKVRGGFINVPREDVRTLNQRTALTDLVLKEMLP